MSETKITNCRECGTNPWKQGCYALWGGKGLAEARYKELFQGVKTNDSGYTCSVCAFKISHDPRFVDCPIYGKHQEEGRRKDGVAFVLKLKKDENDDPDLAEKVMKAIHEK